MVLRRVPFALLLIAIVLLASGCGGPTKQKVSGNVTLNKKPLETGLISFFPSGSDAPAGGTDIKAGRYELPAAIGLAPGNYKVSISSSKGGPAPKEGEAPGVSTASVEEIPEQYNSKTTLSIEVKAGAANDFPFDLESKGKK